MLKPTKEPSKSSLNQKLNKPKILPLKSPQPHNIYSDKDFEVDFSKQRNIMRISRISNKMKLTLRLLKQIQDLTIGIL
jgi:hypothetical protein